MAGGFRARLAAITLVALAVRVAYVLTVGEEIPTIGDARTYHRLAGQLADGHGYVRPDVFETSGVEVPTAEFPPLFPALLALVDLAGAGGVQAQKLVMAVVGAGTVALIGVLGRLVSGPVVGLVAAAVAAGYPMLFGIDGALMPETVYVALVSSGLICAWRGHATPSPARWFVLGAGIGAATLTRSEAVFFVPLLVVPLGVALRWLPWHLRLSRMALAVGGVALLLVPWTIRNAVRLDHFVPLSNNLGGLVVGANCPPSYFGEFKGLWRFECHEPVDVAGKDETQRSRAFLGAGIDYARDHASDVPGVLGVRLLRTWGLYEPTGQIDWETFEGRDRSWQTAGHRMYLALLAFAVGGAVVLRHRRVWHWPLLVTPIVAVLVTIAAYGNQRFRVTAEPAIVVLAATAVVAAADRLRRVRRTLGAQA